MRNALMTAAGIALLAVMAGCLDDDVTGTRPVALTMSADLSTALVGEAVTFSFQATGTSLSQVTLDFGDGETDLHTYFGPVEAAGFSVHTYAAAGTYVVRGEVIAAVGSTTDSVTVVIN